MNLDYGSRNHHQNLATDADEIEIDALRLGSATIDSGLQDERIASAMDDFQRDGDEPDWIERDVANDTATSGISREIQRRLEILGDAYPFEIDGNAIAPKANYSLLTYTFCLAASHQRNITAAPFTELPRAFELLAKEYSKAHLGPAAESLHTGWPRQPGAPVKFRALADDIHAQTGEWFWGTQEGLEDEDSNRIKDGGIDFITWVRSPDYRPGQLFILGQCACGQDWPTKFNDVDLDKLDYWFHPKSWVKPVKAFCTPYALVDGYLFDASHAAGLVYDRFRLARLALDYEATLKGPLKDCMRACIGMVLADA